MTSKNYLLASEIVAAHHTRYSTNVVLKENLLKNPDDYKLTFLVEQTMASVGGHQFVDGYHYDLDDGSEIKTASIRVNGAAGSINSFAGEITGVTSANGTRKSGPIRLVIYNPHTQSLMYYFLPKTCWEKHVTRHPTSGVGKVVYSYNKRNDEIAKFEPYRVKSFEELASKKA